VKSGKKSNRTLHLKTGHSPNYNATFHHEFTYVHFPLKCAYYFNAYLNEFSVIYFAKLCLNWTFLSL